MSKIVITIEVLDGSSSVTVSSPSVVSNLESHSSETNIPPSSHFDPQPEGPSVEDVKAALLSAHGKVGKKAIEALRKFGVQRASELKPEQFGEVIEVLNGLAG